MFGQIYYREVRALRPFASLACSIALLASLAGCDRGSRPTQVNIPAPDFTVSDGSRTVHLADYRGQVVVLNFWATWCAPCVAEIPSLIAMQRELPQVKVLAISIDENEDAYKNFLIARHVDLITVRDPQQTAANKFHTSMWPETYVIDREGRIRRKFIGAQDWTTSEITQYLQSL